ncbi:HlyD family efflux transporter periplasmic adaptor subunit [Salinicola sp. CR57]|uniref:HlyD family efflux transporter periplasmic adaptor subunit n=1 Tax=Salinicola sp. CR57 TaxID=1949086 RepID=UPI000DA25731|nr:HlyD family efflux transporter periplasmic adaptor subunit [Salinicola sp. CR57]
MSDQHNDTDQLRHERRDERRHVRVEMPFDVRLGDGHVAKGHDLSMGGFSAETSMPLERQREIPVALMLTASGIELALSATARPLREIGEGRSQLVAFEFTRMEPRQRDILRRVIRAQMSGRHVSLDGLIDPQDAQTPRKRRSNVATPATRPKRRVPMFRYLALLVAAGVLTAAVAATVYRNVFLIEPSFAAVTAPRTDILAPGAGQLKDLDLKAGDKVERDQPLIDVNNAELQNDLLLSQASFDYNKRLIENLQQSLDDAGNSKVSVATSSNPANGELGFETLSPEIAKTRVEQFETARDYESSRIDAYKARVAANTIYSPCDCEVAWALSAAGGTYVNEGDRVMTLVSTSNNDVMVEALVHMEDIGDIENHQKAYIALPNASEPIPARVRSVALDVERQPRAGFPDWVRQQQNVASVLLVPESPLPASTVGTPVDVRFTDAPMLDTAAEWTYQAGRAMAQGVQSLWGRAADGMKSAMN